MFSSLEELGCSELLQPAVCSFRTIASVLRRLESRTSAIIGYCLKLPGRTCVPGTFLTLQKKGRFSSRYRILPQTHADVLKHLWLPIPPYPVVKSCLPPIIDVISGMPSRGFPHPDLHPQLL